MDSKRTGDTLETGTQSQLAEILDEFTERVLRGEDPDVEQFAIRYPEIADQVRQLLTTMLAVREMSDVDVLGEGIEGHPDRRSLGDFRIRREVGRGGMGIVYEADQVSLGRRVALKMLPFAAVLDEKRLRRFKNEAYAAAQLHHEHIVPVYAIGCERGVHYYAMQFVDGCTLGALIADLRGDAAPTLLSTAARQSVDSAGETRHPPSTTDPVSRAMWDVTPRTRDYYQKAAVIGRHVAGALHHAHECGVVHRDIKPSNLMLDATGKVWVTDFGLAQVEVAPDITLSGDVIGTFRYMSPEQAMGDRASIDRHSDIYSLGVTLYELLTLTPAISDVDRRQILRKVIEEDPPPLRQIDPRIPVDLETITMKCIAKSPTDRYATAAQLSEDLQRYLSDVPITARPPSFARRATKWVRRHRLLVGWGAATLVLAVVGLAISLGLVWNEKRQTDAALRLADANFWKAHQLVEDYFTAISEERLIREPGMQPLRKELLERAHDYYQRLTREHRTDALFRRELAISHFRLGLINAEIGTADEALSEFTAAREIWQSLLDRGSVADFDRMQLAATHLQLGRRYREQGDGQAALAAHAEAMSMLQPLLLKRPEDVVLQRLLAQVCTSQGVAYELLQQPVAAIDRHEEAVAVLQRLLVRSPAALNYQLDLAEAFEEVGHAQEDADQLEAARDSYAKCLDVCRQIVKQQPNLLSVRRLMASARSNGVLMLTRLGKTKEALEEYRLVLSELEHLSQENPAVTAIQLLYAATLCNLAELHFMNGQYTDAEARYDTAGEVLERVPIEARDAPDYLVIAGAHRQGYGLVGEARSDYLRATESLQAAVKLRERLVDQRRNDRNQLLLAESCSRLGLAYRATLQWEDAEHWGGRACEIACSLSDANPENATYHSLVGAHCNNLGITYMRQDKFDAAMRQYDKAIDHQGRALRLSPTLVRHGDMLANHYCNKAILFDEHGQLDEAAVAYQMAATVRAKLAEQHPDDPRMIAQWARNMSELASVETRRGDDVAGQHAFRKAEDLYASLPERFQGIPMVQSFRAQSLEGLARLQHDRLRDAASANATLSQAIGLQRQAHGAMPTNQDYRQRLASHLYFSGKWQLEADDLPESRAACDEATGICQKSFDDDPQNADAVISLALCRSLRADLELAADAPDQALAAAEQGSTLWRQLLQRDSPPPLAVQELAAALSRQAIALERLDRRPDAQIATEEAVGLLEKSAAAAADEEATQHALLFDDYSRLVRLHRENGRLALAVLNARKLKHLFPGDPSRLAQAALAVAELAQLLDSAASTESAEETVQADALLDEACDVLTQAVEHGFHDFAPLQDDPRYRLLRQHAKYEPLRERAAPK